MSLTKRLVKLIRDKAVTDSDLRSSALFVLDALANSYASRGSVPAKKVLRWYASQGDDAGRQALAIGALTHILETDDLHKASVTHPGCVVVPAALAVAAGSQIVDRMRHATMAFGTPAAISWRSQTQIAMPSQGGCAPLPKH